MENPAKYLVTAGGRITCLRCSAMSKRTRLQCAKPALNISKTQKCQFHGGKSTGPKSAEGKARIAAAHLKYGNETVAIRTERAQKSLLLAKLEDVLHVADMSSARRTRGRKPNGYQPITTVEGAREFMVTDILQQVAAHLDDK